MLSSQLSVELRKFRIAAEQSIEMMVFADPEGIVTWCNQAVEQTTGFTVEETIGKKAGVLWGKLMSNDWYADLWHTIKTDKKIFTSEIENHRKDSTHFWSTITIYPLLDDHRQIQFFIATQRDITREKEVDRMKTEFISLASHQLRTPLTTIKWYLESIMLEKKGKLEHNILDKLVTIDQANERMIELVNGLLNISRIESGRLNIEPVSTNLVKLTRSIITELKDYFQAKHQTCLLQSSPHLPNITLDPKLIKQVFVNLLTNANKYTSPGGKIKIKLSLKGSNVIVQIIDNGYGVPPKEQHRLFERFYRASNITKIDTFGTGLGLYMAKSIITTSGGKIWFESKEGEGSTFSFSLPL